MLHAFGNDDKFAFADRQLAVAEFDDQRAFDNEKQLIFVLVMMPDELAFELASLTYE